MQLPFVKYSGCGNDFILLDNRTESFPKEDSAYVRALCHRHEGIGADGVILLENSLIADFKMLIFNSDGSEAEMCGNGIRCLFKFIHRIGYPKQSYSIETKKDILRGFFEDEEVTICMPTPKQTQWHLNVSILKHKIPLHFLDTGVPHVVIFVEDTKKVDLSIFGPLIRHHSDFSPRGVNVNWASISSNQELDLRTYERGVEGETKACGTGATAAALAASSIFQLSSPIKVRTLSEEVLEIGFKNENHFFSDITLRGPANFIFEGVISCDMRKTKITPQLKNNQNELQVK